MSMNRRRLAALVAVVCAAAALLGATRTEATDTHWREGHINPDLHSAGSHYRNPAHMWVVAKAVHDGPITSGGRYHNGCDHDTTCTSANGGDWSMDIGGGTAVSLHLTYDSATFVDPVNATVTIDHDRPIRIRSVAYETGTYSSGDPACLWQRFSVKLSYWGTNDQQYDNEIADLWFGHISNPVYSNGTPVPTNASIGNPLGDGLIYYTLGRKLADVYQGAGNGDCSGGTHTHVDVYPLHAWGSHYEWHSTVISTGEYGPDDYVYGPYNEVHGTDEPGVHTPYPNYRPDSVTRGDSKVFLLGGGTWVMNIINNPQSPYHGVTPQPEAEPGDEIEYFLHDELKVLERKLALMLGAVKPCDGDDHCEEVSERKWVVPNLLDRCERVVTAGIATAVGYEPARHEADVSAVTDACAELTSASEQLDTPGESRAWTSALRRVRGKLSVAPTLREP